MPSRGSEPSLNDVLREIIEHTQALRAQLDAELDGLPPQPPDQPKDAPPPRHLHSVKAVGRKAA